VPVHLRCIGIAMLAWFAAISVGAQSPPIEILAPIDGQTLVAGSDVELVWAPAALRAEHPEEWEVFLSLDGGRTWSARITPHLDWDKRRTRFRVPPTPSRQVRLLFRMGDEREERAFLLPLRLAIEVAPGAALSLAGPGLAGADAAGGRSLTAGEAALPGEPGVRMWVEGPRDGAWSRDVAAEAPPALTRSHLTSGHGAILEATAESSEPLSARPQLPCLGAAQPRASRFIRPPARPTGRQLRALLTQRNE
jgi:hypothetical protein